MRYLYKGMKGIYDGINVVPGNFYNFNKKPNPKLFEIVEENQEEPIEKIKEKPIEKVEITELSNVYTVMERIQGVGKKSSAEIAEEYSDLEELKNDIENGTFSVGGMSDKKIRLIKKELEIGE